MYKQQSRPTEDNLKVWRLQLADFKKLQKMPPKEKRPSQSCSSSTRKTQGHRKRAKDLKLVSVTSYQLRKLPDLPAPARVSTRLVNQMQFDEGADDDVEFYNSAYFYK
eukprot:bmy_01324T0